MMVAPGGLIHTAALWSDGTGDYPGDIYLRTDKQDFNTGMGKANGEYDVDVRDGLLLGAFGANA